MGLTALLVVLTIINYQVSAMYNAQVGMFLMEQVRLVLGLRLRVWYIIRSLLAWWLLVLS